MNKTVFFNHHCQNTIKCFLNQCHQASCWGYMYEYKENVQIAFVLVVQIMVQVIYTQVIMSSRRPYHTIHMHTTEFL